MNNPDELAGLPENVREAIGDVLATLTSRAPGMLARFQTIRAELLRLARENAELRERLKCWKDSSDNVHDAWQADRDQLEALRAKIVEAKNAELFEDGLSADLHSDGINTLPEAYLQGRQDALSEIDNAKT